MYILELIGKIIKSGCTKKSNKTLSDDEQSEYEKCNHIYVPTDSTGLVLACTKCGLVVRKSNLLKQTNFFNNKKNEL